MSTDRVVDYDNAIIPELFSIERFHRKLEVDGRFGHGAYGIFATPRDEALRLLAQSDVIVLTDAVPDRSYPFPINNKIREYWDEIWRQTNRDRELIYSTEILGPYRVFCAASALILMEWKILMKRRTMPDELPSSMQIGPSCRFQDTWPGARASFEPP
jgi:hypothetical protein